jgi:hypothetical protein
MTFENGGPVFVGPDLRGQPVSMPGVDSTGVVAISVTGDPTVSSLVS